jgi:hypothetical protein
MIKPAGIDVLVFLLGLLVLNFGSDSQPASR